MILSLRYLFSSAKIFLSNAHVCNTSIYSEDPNEIEYEYAIKAIGLQEHRPFGVVLMSVCGNNLECHYKRCQWYSNPPDWS